LIALSSYNKFKNNCFSDAVIVCTVNCATSIFAGFAIFTVVGHMAHTLRLPVDKVVDGGFGLAFVAYPEAISQLPAPTVWAILFFLMLFTLGLDSQFTILETVVTAIADQYPSMARKKRWMLMLGTAVVMFLLALNCVIDGGIYWVNLIDHYAAGWGLLIVAVLELVGVSYIYGGNRFIEDIEMMIGKKHWSFWLYWRACWFVISPLLLAAVLIWSLATFKPASYGSYPYPDWANAVGWLIIATGLIGIPILAILSVVGNKCNIFAACRAAPDWGPYLKQFRDERYAGQEEPVEALKLHAHIGAENPAYAPDDETKM
jgi:solute carrier family 6 amino acid transporter-like protein 5/7/9/14